MIDYNLVQMAVADYQLEGFEYLETPWVVSEEALKVTLPADKEGYQLHKCIPYDHPILPTQIPYWLVGSAEQGFIQLMLEGKLSKGKYCSAGPCFRDDKPDEWHHPYFFKVELIDYLPEKPDVLSMLNAAKFQLEQMAQIIVASQDYARSIPSFTLEVVPTEEGHDLMLDGIELGSYGLRKYQNHTWVYGTGLALPRFTQAINKKLDLTIKKRDI